MGLVAACRATFAGQISEGKAHLEPDFLSFRGDFSLKIPLRQIESFLAQKGKLKVKFSQGTAVFELGPQAEKWALKIRYPKSIMDKLGVKPGLKISVLGISEANFFQQLRARGHEIYESRAAKASDLIFFAVDDARELRKLQTLARALKPNGGILAIWPKGQKHIKEDMIRAAALQQGLVDVKVVSFSETHSGLKLVIPVALR